MKPPEMTAEFNRLSRVRMLIARLSPSRQTPLLVRLKKAEMSIANAPTTVKLREGIETVERLASGDPTALVP
jgi:hypothetical protein